jgi:hypothetical protein
MNDFLGARGRDPSNRRIASFQFVKRPMARNLGRLRFSLILLRKSSRLYEGPKKASTATCIGMTNAGIFRYETAKRTGCDFAALK